MNHQLSCYYYPIIKIKTCQVHYLDITRVHQSMYLIKATMFKSKLVYTIRVVCIHVRHIISIFYAYAHQYI